MLIQSIKSSFGPKSVMCVCVCVFQFVVMTEIVGWLLSVAVGDRDRLHTISWNEPTQYPADQKTKMSDLAEAKSCSPELQ